MPDGTTQGSNSGQCHSGWLRRRGNVQKNTRRQMAHSVKSAGSSGITTSFLVGQARGTPGGPAPVFRTHVSAS
jgi:hypothetical protein